MPAVQSSTKRANALLTSRNVPSFPVAGQPSRRVWAIVPLGVPRTKSGGGAGGHTRPADGDGEKPDGGEPEKREPGTLRVPGSRTSWANRAAGSASGPSTAPATR